MTRRASDEGSGTVLVLAVAGALCLVLIGFTAVARVSVLRRRAAAAADLAALSGAATAYRGPEAACAVARRVAQRNGAVLDRCSVTDLVVTVTTSIRFSTGRRTGAHNVRATARAGPAHRAW